ncbi:MAG: Excinuclease ABC C subunit domain protein [candidate division WWE3 bacterium GW2011_GWA1_46_21]|uniref:Excinuclease ABC C subunit domain protein n=4 Tax=Katanobacteria TaxID=422282 RepID=A0A0G1PG61_UNCKA|nr:MAG: Excinuclease ABC C subunit domain protein [candidate division WWE3 bacterium GW2011_GWA1_46_21]KKU49229.1 MAG: Excinuclease ABC C subunit domain protein [candidate division WWE3 bacterium GW2011_GWA2_46_9]KKU51176.1 MAG: Excinuclease ABC C subunit domain protein [candidate division WWE3 bacterium GW2011_GWC1_47_10]KKU57770.1 MAG: Excinuclease ABC C subunit domain protein [candidate division WWE3 bacterium GW2011_GWB1_47_11]
MTTNDFLLSKVKALPKAAGVYMFVNKNNDVIYVGKAKILRDRVSSYFGNDLDPASKTWQLVQNAADLRHIEVFSEFEALILEADLIRKFKPKYNIVLKDDRSCLYIAIKNDSLPFETGVIKLPKIVLARKKDLLATDVCFGPFPESNTARYVLRMLRKAIPFRDCSKSKYTRYKKYDRPCLFGHLELCPAPCVGRITLPDYKRNIYKVKKVLSGNSAGLLKSIERAMNTAAKKREFEKAGEHRDILTRFNFIRERSRAAQGYIDNPYLVEDTLLQAVRDLALDIAILKDAPKRIECYDISNLSGKEATGAMVVAIDGRISPNDYRRFKIKLTAKPNDVGMLTEVLTRRFKNNWDLPNLLVVDGGKGQVSAALAVLGDLGLTVPVVGLAKRLEEIVFKVGSDYKVLELPRNNNGLKLLQRLRDEAHRFSRRYHHYLRMKGLR